MTSLSGTGWKSSWYCYFMDVDPSDITFSFRKRPTFEAPFAVTGPSLPRCTAARCSPKQLSIETPLADEKKPATRFTTPAVTTSNRE